MAAEDVLGLAAEVLGGGDLAGDVPFVHVDGMYFGLGSVESKDAVILESNWDRL